MRLQLHIQHREADRLVVTVEVHAADGPGDDAPVELDGVCVQLVCGRGKALGPRVVLPLRGTLHGPVSSTVALLTDAAIPRGARVVAKAWSRSGDAECCTHVDRSTDLESHMRGFRCCVAADSDAALEPLTAREHASLASFLPWIGTPAQEDEGGGRAAVDDGADADDIAATYGLDEGDADLLRELLSE